jgi:ABC-type antimicrobial peptide transport system permease subunit
LHIDAKLAEKDNDAYWRKYKAAPRLFISIGAARKLWGGAFGDLTSIRIPAARADEFARMLRDTLDPASMGLAFRPVKAEQIAAASGGGSNEFSMIFVSLSFFLIAAAVLLVAMLFRLNVEQRARQIGLLAAVGFAPKHLRRVSLLEGMILAIIGGLLGLPAAAGYTWLIIYGLRTWWVGAVGTTALRLHVDPVTLAEGFVSGLVVAFFAVLWGVWRVGRTPAAQLLAGSFASVVRTKLRAARITLGAGILLSLGGLGVLAMSLGKSTPPEAALAGGAMLLAAFICLSAATLRPRHHAGAVMSSVTRLGIRNASRHTARSVLSAGLIAFATFTLIIVASMRQRAPEDTGNPGSGAGGYRLMVRAGIPLLGDLSTPRGREMLGVTDRDNPLWSSARFMSMRRWAGQDVSCLNLCRPGSPTILAVPHEMVQRGGFSFAPEEKEKNQWALLESPQANDDIPVIADSETAQYILHLPLGGVLPFTDQSGASRKLKLVATLSGSIFQSELLMGEASFRRLFPSQSGFGVVLVETPADQMRSVEQLLNRELEEYAVSVDTTAARLAMYQEVANTYLSTFQTLGALGLMLGTIGLSVVLVRNVIERRPELALLGAIGFPVRDRIVLILSENAFILALGLIAGTICALLGIAPTLLRTHGSVAIGSLAITLAAVLVVGLLASIAAVFIAGLRASPAALRSE